MSAICAILQDYNTTKQYKLKWLQSFLSSHGPQESIHCGSNQNYFCPCSYAPPVRCDVTQGCNNTIVNQSTVHHCDNIQEHYDLDGDHYDPGGAGRGVNDFNCCGYFPLLVAVALRDVEICGLLLHYGAKVDMSVPEPYFQEVAAPTPLHQACADGNMELVQLMLSQVTTVIFLKMASFENYMGQTAALLAAENGNCDLVNFLHQKGCCFTCLDKSGNSALHLSLEGNTGLVDKSENASELVKIFLDAGLSPQLENKHGTSPLSLAIFFNLKDIIIIFINYMKESSFLKIILSLIYEEEQPCCDLMDVLGRSSVTRSEMINAVSYLVINAKSNLLRDILDQATSIHYPFTVNARPLMGQSLLSLACKAGCMDTINILLKHGADPNMPDLNGTRPLDRAILSVNTPLVYVLLVHGAHCHMAHEGLSNALFLGSPDIAQLLLVGGLDLDLPKSKRFNWIKLFNMSDVGSDFIQSIYRLGYRDIYVRYIRQYAETCNAQSTHQVPPLSLQILSSMTIRKQLQGQVYAKVNQLPLPTFLKKILLLQV